MPSETQNTKKKILAYKKLEKYKSENTPQLSEQVFEGEIFLGRLELKCKKNTQKPLFELAYEIYESEWKSLQSEREKKIKEAEVFAEAHHLPLQEKREHIERVKKLFAKLEAKLIQQYEFNFSLMTGPFYSGKTYGISRPAKLLPSSIDGQILKYLRAHKYVAYAVDKLGILLQNGIAKQIEEGEYNLTYDIAVNGTFYDSKEIFGTIIINGKKKTFSTNPKVPGRGVLAQLKNGGFAIFRKANNPKNIKMGSVSQSMGGGMIFIEEKKAASNKALVKEQKFNQGTGGNIENAWKCTQMQKAVHTIFALKSKQLFVIQPNSAHSKHLEDIKNEFLQMPPKLRFDFAIKFDGGSSYLLYRRGCKLEHGKDAKHVRCGFGINIIGEK